ncbi:MAG: OB-fold domain-containing protein [Burkholderiaceae bacterium]|jgi:uncharacterized OB-fold protein
MKSDASYLPRGLPAPVTESDGLSAPYWAGLTASRLLVQHCAQCGTWQFGPEWICHHCLRFELAWEEVAPHGTIFSWERVWNPSHASLKERLPYLVVLVELAHAKGVRLLGNLLGDPTQEPLIGAQVRGIFEHHLDADPPYSLLQWQCQT